MIVEIDKIEAGCYGIKTDDGAIYKVIKDSYLGGWGIFEDNQQTTHNRLLMSKNTKKECLSFIESNFKDLSAIKDVPIDIPINSAFKIINDYADRVWIIDDVIYSTLKGKWIIQASYFRGISDLGERFWNIDEFRELCEVVDVPPIE